MNNKEKEHVVQSEYENARVPLDKRRGFWGLFAVWMGYVFVVTTMQVGGIIALGSDFRQLMLSTLISCSILFVLAAFMAYISQREGLTFTLMCRYAFGRLGLWIPVFLVIITCVSWFSIDAWLIGATVHTLMPSIPIVPICILAVAAITITALYGIRAMTWLSNIAVPLIFIFGIISMVKSVNTAGIDNLINQVPDVGKAIPMTAAIALGVGSFSHGAIANTAEVLRFSKSPKQAIGVMFIAMMFGNAFMLLFGGLGMLSTGEYDMGLILKAQGLLGPAFAVVILNLWSTAQGLVYASINAIGAAIRVQRKWIALGIGVIALIMALNHFIDHFGAWIDVNAKFIPPFAGIIIGDYFVLYGRKFPDPEKYEEVMPKVNYSGLITWIVGSLLAGFSLLEFGIPTFNYILVCVALKVILSKYVFKDDKLILDLIKQESAA